MTETQPIRRAFVVVRTRHVQAGTPRIVAELADVGIGVESPYAGAEILRREDMLADPGLAEALRVWDGGDDELLANEVTAFEIAERRRSRAARSLHPSAIGDKGWVPV